MGSFPPNWTQQTSNVHKAVGKAAVDGARSNPYIPIGSQLGVTVRYDPEKFVPPTGIYGCWEISVRHPHRRDDPLVYWRQDQDEAASLVARSLSENLYDGYLSPPEARTYVEWLESLAPGPRTSAGPLRPVPSQRAYSQEDPSLPGFIRFFSADSRFPISLSIPTVSFFYDFNRANYLHLKCYGSGDEMLRVDKEALRDARDRAAQEYLCGSRDLFWLMAQGEERKGHKYQIAKREKDFVPLGVDGFRVPLITWTGVENGERVFFPGREHGVLWSIARFGDQGLDAQQFRSVLSSFRWLHEDFFQSVRGQ